MVTRSNSRQNLSSMYADFGAISLGRPVPRTADFLQRAMTASASLPTIRFKTSEKNPILGFFPEEAIETRDWMTQSSRTHTPLANPSLIRNAGQKTEAPNMGAAEALGVEGHWRRRAAAQKAAAQRAAPKAAACSPHARGQSYAKRRTIGQRPPTPAELDAFLASRSRARGLGGWGTSTVDVVQTKWSVLYTGQHRAPPNRR